MSTIVKFTDLKSTSELLAFKQDQANKSLDLAKAKLAGLVSQKNYIKSLGGAVHTDLALSIDKAEKAIKSAEKIKDNLATANKDIVWSNEVNATQQAKESAISKLSKLASLEGALKLAPVEGKNRDEKRSIKAFLVEAKLECLMVSLSDKTALVGLDALGNSIKVAFINNKYVLA